MTSGAVVKRGAAALEALTRVEAELFPALYEDMTDLASSMQENLGTEGLQITDLPRIPMPAGKSTTWEIPDPLGGKPEPTAQLDFLLTYWTPARVWWPVDLADPNKISGDPPQCSSVGGVDPLPGGTFALDGAQAGRNPGGKCITCPMSKFGSNEKTGKGQACSDRRLFFILPQGEVLPLLVSTPPTSKKSLHDFFLGLMRKYTGVHYSSFQLRYELETVSKDGNNYAVVKPSVLSILEGARPTSQGGPVEGSPAHAAYLYHQQFAKLLDTTALVTAAAATDRAPVADDDDVMPSGLGGDFADHGEPAGT